MNTYKFFVPTPDNHKDAQSLYRKLAKENHPDLGGELETMKAINAEYATLIVDIEKGNQRTRQTAAHAEGRKTVADFHDLNEVGETLAQVIMNLLNMNMPDVTIELVGLWIWVTGETKPHKDELKKLGLRWAHKKLAWSYAGVPSFHTGKSLDAIRSTYGSTVYMKAKKEEREEIPATV